MYKVFFEGYNGGRILIGDCETLADCLTLRMKQSHSSSRYKYAFILEELDGVITDRVITWREAGKAFRESQPACEECHKKPRLYMWTVCTDCLKKID
jgi:hypothetical protein